MIQQFLMIAAAHFLALLSPGPDFFLVARTSIASGWRIATGACVGIAVANGLFIVAAFGGIAILQAGSTAFFTIQLAGCVYLLYMGWMFIRHAGSSAQANTDTAHHHHKPASWWRGAGAGFLSGLLNPKNALFYVSLATMVGGTSSAGWKWAYGAWMFSIVLLWDVLVAAAIGNHRVLNRFSRMLPWLERTSGAMLLLLAAMVLATSVRQLAGLQKTADDLVHQPVLQSTK